MSAPQPPNNDAGHEGEPTTMRVRIRFENGFECEANMTLDNRMPDEQRAALLAGVARKP